MSKNKRSKINMDAGQSHQVLSIFNGKPDLNFIYPERKVFDAGEALAFYACMCRYFTDVGNIDSADLYMDAILKNGFIKEFGQTVLKGVLDNLCNAKWKK